MGIISDFGGVLGAIGGSVAGGVAGGIHAGIKLIASGGDFDKAGDAFEETFDVCLEGGVEIGEELAPGIVSAIVVAAGGEIAKKSGLLESEEDKKKRNS